MTDHDVNLLLPEISDRCPACGSKCPLGVRGRDALVVNCPEHGVAAVDRNPERPLNRMDPEERLWIMTAAVLVFLAGHEDGDFVVFQVLDLPCNYAQLRSNDGHLGAEVCSRQWGCRHCGDRPLDPNALERVNRLGFTGGGPHRNFELRSLAASTDLAHLMEDVLLAAYGEPVDFGVAVYPQGSDMTLDLVRRLRA